MALPTSMFRMMLALGLVTGWASDCWAQGDAMFTMMDTTVADCIGELTDSGGLQEAYGNNEDLVFTVDAGSPLQVEFIGAIEIEPAAPGGAALFDYLVLHDGPSLASPVLDTLYGLINNPPGYVTSGALTVHFVSDASAQPEGFHLRWTANPPPPDPPVATLSGLGDCPHPAMTLALSFPIECELIDWNSFQWQGQNGQNWAMDSTVAINLSCSNGTTDGLILPFVQGDFLQGNCDITVQLNVGVRDACDSIWMLPIAGQWSSTDCEATPLVTLEADSICAGGCSVLEALPRGCGPTVISWSGSDGTASSGDGPWTLCPESTTTYTVTAIETETGISGSQDITLSVILLGAWNPDTVLCPHDEWALSQGTVQGQWEGPGISGPPWIFSADSSGPGLHVLQFNTIGSTLCSSETTVEVLDVHVPEFVATCPDSSPFELESTPSLGVWSGDGISGSTFDPSAVADSNGLASVTATFTFSGCADSSIISVQPPAPLVSLGNVCQSEPSIVLPENPPGGVWSGAGWSDDDGMFVPEDAPAGAIALTYAMQGCNSFASGTLLPIQAGPTSTSCPEQPGFVPYPDFFPSGGLWDGPGIVAEEAETGFYNPSLVPNGQWSPLVYSAPNGCTDTLWMFNRQTEVIPDLLHLCQSDTSNLLDQSTVQVTPWCGAWNSASAANIEYLGDCDWSATAELLPMGAAEFTYSVNGCIDTLTWVVHPDSLDMLPLVTCIEDSALTLPILPSGAQWSGSGILAPDASAPHIWSWSPFEAGGGIHPLIWTSPAGCTDTVLAGAEVAPVWDMPFDSVSCANSLNVQPPVPTYPGVTNSNAAPTWTIDGATWAQDTTTLSLGTGSHEVQVQWSGAACDTESSWTMDVLPLLQVNLTVNDSTLCAGVGTEAVAVAGGGLSSSEPMDIVWSDGGLPLLSRILQPDSSSWWTIHIDDGCSDPASDSTWLSVLPPIQTAHLTGPMECHGVPSAVLLDAASPINVLHIVEGDTLGAGPISLDMLAGNTFSWTLYDPQEGCSMDTNIWVPSHPPLTAAFGISPALDCIPWDAQPIRFIDFSQGADFGQWTWSPVQVEDQQATADSLDWAFAVNPNLTLTTTGTWEVQLVVNQNPGCTDTTQQTLCLLPEVQVWMPDAFSPNQDLSNDRFRPRGSGVKEWKMRICNRWGELVWEEQHVGLPADSELKPATDLGYPIGWDGANAPVGVYAVRLEGVSDGGSPFLLEQALRLIR